MTSTPTRPAGPATATVDLGAIRHNVGVLRDHAGDAAVMVVVKADGYGHGLVPAARAALAGGAAWLGVATMAEARQVRGAGIAAPLLTWLHVPGEDFAWAVGAGVDVSVSALWSLSEVAQAARAVGRPARVHLKVDTGLGRNGAFGDAWPVLLDAARGAETEGVIQVVGVWSHFAYADAPQHPTVRQQQARFLDAVADAERAGCRLEVRHLANSAATLTNPSARFDLVRPGLAAYGLSPVPDLPDHAGDPAAYGLVPAMTLTARVATVKDMPAGQGLSYGHQYLTRQDTRVALVPTGYADGIPRNATNVGPLMVAGIRCTVSGRVCMDQLVVDVGPTSTVQPGDEVVLFGPGERGEPTAEDWARATGTISYEIVTRIGPRVPRVYVEERYVGGQA